MLLKILDKNIESIISFHDWLEPHGFEDEFEVDQCYQAVFDNMVQNSRLVDEALARLGVEIDLLRPSERCDTSSSLGMHFTDFHALTNSQLFRVLDSWQTGRQNETGVSLSDLGTALGFADEELTDFVRRFSKSKKIKCEPIGKCPINGRRQLYRLFEILRNLHDFTPLSQAEKQRIQRGLEALQREPA